MSKISRPGCLVLLWSQGLDHLSPYNIVGLLEECCQYWIVFDRQQFPQLRYEVIGLISEKKDPVSHLNAQTTLVMQEISPTHISLKSKAVILNMNVSVVLIKVKERCKDARWDRYIMNAFR